MGGKQLGFGDYEQTTAKKRTRRERFLAEMEVVVPWKREIVMVVFLVVFREGPIKKGHRKYGSLFAHASLWRAAVCSILVSESVAY
jgi:hypothetical protein